MGSSHAPGREYQIEMWCQNEVGNDNSHGIKLITIVFVLFTPVMATTYKMCASKITKIVNCVKITVLFLFYVD